MQQAFEGGPTCPRASNSFAYGVSVPEDQRNGLPDPGRLGAEPPKVDLHVAGASLLNAIGNRVWEDWDHDGQQDSVLTEPGIADVRVELYSGASLVDTTFTDSDGWYMGELNRSSQHLTMMEVCSGATTTVGRQGASPGDEVPRPADAGASCGARVLASDRSRQEHRGRRCGDRGVGPCRVAVVPSRWRHAACEPHRADRPVLVVC